MNITALCLQPELIEAHGYKAEIHEIWTEDGYGLNVHRVLPPNDRVSCVPNVDSSINASNDNSIEYHNSLNSSKASSCTGASPRLPVLLCHGFICSSADWVLLGPQEALGNQIFYTFSNRFSFPFSFIFYFIMLLLLFTIIYFYVIIYYDYIIRKNIFQLSRDLKIRN
jgi:hypothetical protein